MSEKYPPGQPRDKATLEQQIMNSCIAKNDAEWWAMREIERLRASNAELVVELEGCLNALRGVGSPKEYNKTLALIGRARAAIEKARKP